MFVYVKKLKADAEAAPHRLFLNFFEKILFKTKKSNSIYVEGALNESRNGIKNS